MSRHILKLLFLVSLVEFCQGQGDVCVIQEETVSVVTPIQVCTITESSEKLNVPVRSQPLKSIIPDGTKVTKGDLVAVFDDENCRYQLNALLLKQKVIESNLTRQISDIDGKNLDMGEQLDSLEDKLASLESKLQRQKSEPTEDDIRIVEGRLRIAELNVTASRKEFAKDQDRFKRQMISRAQMETTEKELLENEAKYRFACQELEDTKNPPERAGNIRLTEIDIENARLEIQKLKQEIDDQLNISEIQKKGVTVNRERNQREIKEKQEDLESVQVRAPRDGYVSNSTIMYNEIVPGMKLYHKFMFMQIPDLKTIAFKGTLPEHRRQFHREGDEVLIRLNGRKQEPLQGVIKSISTLSHDMAEKEDVHWAQNKKFGVNVFDIVISLKSDAPELRAGVNGTAELIATQKVTGPVVPLRFVRLHDGKVFLFWSGEYHEVTGNRVGAQFMLDDREWTGRTIGIGGILERQARKQAEDDERLMSSGELLPVHSHNIVVNNIGWGPWPEVVWLMPEEKMVKKGEIVARLDPTDREKSVLAYEERVTELRSNKDEYVKKVQITERNGNFKLKTSQNNLEKTRISSNETLNIISPIPLHRAEMNLKLAEIRLASQKRKVEREKEKKTPTMSPVEIRNMERELERCLLKLEQAQLKLEQEKEGQSVTAKSRARLNLTNAENDLATTEKQVAYDNLSIKRDLERRKMILNREEKTLKLRREHLKNHTLQAPVDGLLCYNKVLNSGNLAKVAVGNVVGNRFNILSIPDLSEMELKIDLDERYFSSIAIGMEVEVRVPSLTDQKLVGVVKKVDLLFVNKSKQDSQIGIYSSHEPLGEVVFSVRIGIKSSEVSLKPGLLADVYFPIHK